MYVQTGAWWNPVDWGKGIAKGVKKGAKGVAKYTVKGAKGLVGVTCVVAGTPAAAAASNANLVAGLSVAVTRGLCGKGEVAIATAPSRDYTLPIVIGVGVIAALIIVKK